MEQKTASRIAKLTSMLDSNNEGERDNAFNALVKQLQSSNIKFVDILSYSIVVQLCTSDSPSEWFFCMKHVGFDSGSS